MTFPVFGELLHPQDETSKELEIDDRGDRELSLLMILDGAVMLFDISVVKDPDSIVHNNSS